MSWNDFFIIYFCVIASMLICRCVPMFILKGRDINPGFKRILNLIPPATFAALVSNDLLSPTMFSDDLYTCLIPLIASVLVIAISLWKKSLILSICVGVGAYALLLYAPPLIGM